MTTSPKKYSTLDPRTRMQIHNKWHYLARHGAAEVVAVQGPGNEYDVYYDDPHEGYKALLRCRDRYRRRADEATLSVDRLAASLLGVAER